MAESPKRKKLEKTTEPKPVSNQKFYCCRCGIAYSRQKGYFLVSHSPMYRGSGYLPICNDCVEDMYESYRASLKDDKEAMRRMCMKLDLYWSEKIYAAVERSAGVHSRIRNYIGKTNIIHYIDKTFDDTIMEEGNANQRLETQNPEEDQMEDSQPDEEEVVEQSVIDFWGTEFKADFYNELERRYADWTGGCLLYTSRCV